MNKKDKIKRKVVVVYGRFDETSDFVIEPATDSDEDYFYIEGEKQ